MKKITFSIFAFLMLTIFTLQVQAQACPEVWTENGTYKISTCGLTTELYMTINGSTGALEWAEELSGDDPTQVWTITDHRDPDAAGSSFVEIWATIPGVGNYTMAADQGSISGRDITITVVPGDPIIGTGSANYGYDQFQRRRTSGFGGPGNDALFVKIYGGEQGSRYGVTPSAAGDPVQFDGGAIDGLRFHLIATLSNDKFDASSIFVSNPVNDVLSIKGLTSNVKSISIYSLLGKEVMSKEISGASSIDINTSPLTSGMYIVDFKGEGGNFTKKIIKH